MAVVRAAVRRAIEGVFVRARGLFPSGSWSAAAPSYKWRIAAPARASVKQRVCTQFVALGCCLATGFRNRVHQDTVLPIHRDPLELMVSFKGRSLRGGR